MTLIAEILALRQQVAVLNRSVKPPQLHRRDRLFWLVLSKLWKGWREVLVIARARHCGEVAGDKALLFIGAESPRCARLDVHRSTQKSVS